MTQPRCSVSASGVPLIGTAPYAPRGWLVVEHAAPWPARALEAPDLSDFARTVSSAGAEAGVKVVLGRRPRGRQRPGVSDPRTDPSELFWYAGAGAATLQIGKVAALAGALSAATTFRSALERSIAEDHRDPMMLVCVNGKRDLCCSVEGNAVLRGLAGRADVAECSHLGGHRFAATALLLPRGDLHGRLTPESATAVLAAASTQETHLATLRGFSGVPDFAQVALAHVQTATGHTGFAQAQVVASEEDLQRGTAVCTVQDASGTQPTEWTVELQRESLGDVLESCGRQPVPSASWRVSSAYRGS